PVLLLLGRLRPVPGAVDHSVPGLAAGLGACPAHPASRGRLVVRGLRARRPARLRLHVPGAVGQGHLVRILDTADVVPPRRSRLDLTRLPRWPSPRSHGASPAAHRTRPPSQRLSWLWQPRHTFVLVVTTTTIAKGVTAAPVSPEGNAV